MYHLDILKKHYEIKGNKKRKRSFSDLTIQYTLIGEKQKTSLAEIISFLRELFDCYLIKENMEADISKSNIYCSYNTEKSIKDFLWATNEANLDRILKLLLEKDVSTIRIEECQMNCGMENAIKNAEIALEYKDFANYFENAEYNTYEITFSILISLFDMLSDEQLSEMEKMWIDGLCRLNAQYLNVSHHEDFNLYCDFTPMKTFDYRNSAEKNILGFYWVNVLVENHIKLLGGIDKIKKELNEFIIKQYDRKDGSQVILIKLSEKHYELRQKSLEKLKNFFLSYLPPVSNRRIERSLGGLEKYEIGSLAYLSTKDLLERYEFILKNILLMEKDDPRWT